MKKVLILVQACDDPPYFEMQKAQLDTWDSVHVDGVTTVYYYGDNWFVKGVELGWRHLPEDYPCFERDEIGFRFDSETKKLYCPCSEAYDMMHYRHRLATEWCLENVDFDIMFRTNASSYVHKQKLFDFAQTLPTEKLFISKGDYVMSGCGFFLSKDLIKIANEGIDQHPTPSEDMYIATMLNRAGYDVGKEGDRVDFDHYKQGSQRECYHYRCKSDTADRNKDIVAFKKLFKQFHR